MNTRLSNFPILEFCNSNRLDSNSSISDISPFGIFNYTLCIKGALPKHSFPREPSIFVGLPRKSEDSSRLIFVEWTLFQRDCPAFLCDHRTHKK